MALLLGGPYVPVVLPDLAPFVPRWAPLVGLLIAIGGAAVAPRRLPPLRLRPERVVPGEEGTSIERQPPVHPDVLLELDGGSLQRLEPRRWVRDLRQEAAFVGRIGLGTLIGTLAVVAPCALAYALLPASPGTELLLAASVVGPPAFACLLALPSAVELVRGGLAARRLGLRLDGVPTSLAAGQAFEVELVLRPRRAVDVGKVRVLLAGTAEFKVVSGGERRRRTTDWVELLHRAVTELELGERLEPGDERRFRARFEVPRRAAPTRERTRGRSVRWIVAAVAEVPRWPDPGAVVELEVWRSHAARRSG